NGTLVTNGHVVDGSSTVSVRFGTEAAASGAKVLGTDGSSDLAVLKISPQDVPKGVRPLQFGDSSAIAVGDNVIAIGNPFNLDRTATEGIVSGLGRHNPATLPRCGDSARLAHERGRRAGDAGGARRTGGPRGHQDRGRDHERGWQDDSRPV